MQLPNDARNKEIEHAIGVLRNSDAGAHADKQSGVAVSLSNLNLAESIQLLHLQMTQTAMQNRVALEKSVNNLIESNEKLAKSNEKHAKGMYWLTAALVLVAVAQAFFTFAQYKVAGTAINVQRDATGLENAKWQYEMMRNDRLEARDVEWRKEDLERSKKQ